MCRRQLSTFAGSFSFQSGVSVVSAMEESGRNVTPDKLPADERAELFAACDEALALTVDALRPGLVVGVGRFAERRARLVLGSEIEIGSITHPSPASPAATRDWAGTIDVQLRELGFEPG